MSFREKVERLQMAVDESATKQIVAKNPINYKELAKWVVIPLIVLALLLVIRPRFVRKQDKDVINKKKLVRWAILFTVILWGCMAYYQYKM